MKQRLLTAIIAIIIFVPIVLYGEWPFILMAYTVAFIALFELMRMYKPEKVYTYMGISSVFLALLMVPMDEIVIGNYVMTKFSIIIYLVVFLLLFVVLSKNKFTFDDAGFVIVATLYIGLAFYFVSMLRMTGLHYFLFTLFAIWATDTGAYFSGRFLGKRKLWPSISPNKTIAGALGGLVIALIVGIGFYLVYPFEESLLFIIVITIVISVFAQLGDLVASAIKRHYDVKDSGTIFPGHGGIIDRFDSILFVVIILSVIGLI